MEILYEKFFFLILIVYNVSPDFSNSSHQLARYTEQFVLSVIVGNDVIPRLGLITMEKLKVQIMREVHECHKPKVSHGF